MNNDRHQLHEGNVCSQSFHGIASRFQNKKHTEIDLLFQLR